MPLSAAGRPGLARRPTRPLLPWPLPAVRAADTSLAERPARGSDVSAMASAEPERKRKPPEMEVAGGDPAAADEEDEEERWVGPLPGEAAQAKKRRGKGTSEALPD